MSDADILTEDSEVSADGRYRYGLRNTEAVMAAVEAYEKQIEEVVRLIFERGERQHAKAAAEALSAWRDA